MTLSEYNETSSLADVQRTLDYVREHVFEPDAVDISRFYAQWRRSKDPEASKSARFVIEYNIHSEDVRNTMADLAIDQYSTTSIKAGCPKAYVFGVHMPEIIDSDPEVYLKFQIDNGFIIITIHEAERPMDYPYRREKQ